MSRIDFKEQYEKGAMESLKYIRQDKNGACHLTKDAPKIMRKCLKGYDPWGLHMLRKNFEFMVNIWEMENPEITIDNPENPYNVNPKYAKKMYEYFLKLNEVNLDDWEDVELYFEACRISFDYAFSMLDYCFDIG